MPLLTKIADKLTGNSSKNVDDTTTTAPGHGQSSTFGGQNSALDTTAGTTGSSGSSTYGNEGTTGESMLRQNNSGLGTSSTGTTDSSYGTDSTSQYGADGQRKKGLGEKAKEAVGLDPKDGRDPKDMGYNQGSSTAFSGGNQSSTGYNQSGTSSGLGSSTGTTGSSSSYGTDNTQYGADGQRKKGLGEKAKEAVGLDPKDGRDPKDIGYNQSGSSSGLGSSSSSSSYGTGSTQYGADGQRKKGLGEKAKEAVGLDPKDGRDPKDIGYNQSGTSGYSGSQSGIDRQSERMGGLSLGSEHSGKTVVKTAAPIVAERVHDQYENIDKTRVEELHDRTEVTQTVQPVYDERTETTQRSVQDHGLEVHEHGKAGLDTRTEAELAAKREQIARDHRSTHDERTTERSMRPDVDVQSRTTTIEEVVPVVERDIYRPHEIEHTKRVVEIHHEAPEIIGTKVAAPISVSEWERQSGSSLRTTGATTGSGLTGRTRRGSSSSSSSSDEEVEVDGVKTRRKKGLGEKIKEKIGLDPKDGRDPKDAGYTGSSTSSSTGYNQSGTTGTSSGLGSSTGSSQYGADGQRHKGLGEKAKETVGLDPKDGRDPKDISYNQSGSSTGYNQTGTSSGLGSSTGATGSSSSYGTDNTQHGADGQRKKGVGEKIKEAVGLDPKDGRDPKDAGYNQSSSTGTSSGLGSSGTQQGVARDYTGAR